MLPATANLFDEELRSDPRETVEFISGILDSCTEYSIVGKDLDGKIVFWNEGARRLYGYAPEEVVGRVDSALLYTAEDNAVGRPQEILERTLAEGKWEGDIRRVRKHGEEFTARVVITPRRGADGTPIGFLLISRDISEEVRDIPEQRQPEEELRESDSYNRSLIEASVDALFAIAPDGAITDVNAAAERLTGYPRKHLIKSHFADLFTEPERAASGVRQTFAESRVIGYELVLNTRHGRRLTLSFNAGVFADAVGQPQGILAAARDVTQTKQTFQYARSLIESSLDPLVTIAPDGEITDVNDATVEVTGVPREELIGTDFSSYFTEPEKAREGYQQVFEKGTVTDYALTIRSTSGQLTDVLYNAAVYKDAKGKVLGVLAAARDITERKRFEQTLQEKNLELERASLAKDRFLASMSHELRTPLNAIIGFTGTLLMKLPGPLTGDQETQLGTIKNNARHLLSLINDLLDLAKIESGKVDLRLAPVDCQAVLNDVATALRPMAEERGLQFEVSAPKHGVMVETDCRALTQIILNLTNNAIKFTDQGSVKVELKFLADQGVRIKVRDTGVGICEEDQRKLFEAFQQAGNPDSRPEEGTGLGLHLSQKLAHLLGGTIEFCSTFGEGSTFWLNLTGEKQPARDRSVEPESLAL